MPAVLASGLTIHFLLLDNLKFLLQSGEESEGPFSLIAERYERRSLGITSNLIVITISASQDRPPTSQTIPYITLHASVRPVPSRVRFLHQPDYRSFPAHRFLTICQTLD